MGNLFKVRNILLLLLMAMFLAPLTSFAQVAVGVSIRIGPPALPVYEQPPCPHDGYLWTPGYWAYGPDGYFWVPGVWVAAPRVGVLWTPGYWGPHVGFYGGINYGFGYGGVGFVGGEWRGGAFAYNTAVVHVNETVVHVYVNRTVINNPTVVNRTSFNGPGGVTAHATPQEQTAMHEQHFQPTSNQLAHEHTAGQDRNQLASNNHGRPTTAAMDSVNGRAYNQQGRIAQGVRSGQLTPRETGNLEHRESNINREVATDRRANGGKLTPAEHRQVARQQNQASKKIYQDKHNEKTDNRAEKR